MTSPEEPTPEMSPTLTTTMKMMDKKRMMCFWNIRAKVLR